MPPPHRLVFMLVLVPSSAFVPPRDPSIQTLAKLPDAAICCKPCASVCIHRLPIEKAGNAEALISGGFSGATGRAAHLAAIGTLSAYLAGRVMLHHYFG